MRYCDGVAALGDKREYLAVLTQENVDGKEVSVPWPTLLTGMMFIQVFYWSTNQVIVQRAMAAKSLAEGQKGVLFASAMKLVGPLMLCVPAIIALHMTQELTLSLDLEALKAALADSDLAQKASKECLAFAQGLVAAGTTTLTFAEAERLADLGLAFNDQVYPAMVRHVLPAWSLGLFAAVLVGSILSSFNSALNSASTLFSLQFYKGYIKRDATPEEIVSTGKIFGTVIAIAAMVVAPLLASMQSIFAYLQSVNGLYSVPIIAIFLLGITTKRIPAVAAKIGMIVGISAYGFFTFFPIDGFHWLHGYFVSFLAAVVVMLIIGKLKPKSDEEVAISDERAPAPVDMTPWSGAKAASWAIIILTVALYAALTVAAG